MRLFAIKVHRNIKYANERHAQTNNLDTTSTLLLQLPKPTTRWQMNWTRTGEKVGAASPHE